MTHAKAWAWVWGSAEPAFSIGYTNEKLSPTDSGFTVLFDDAPDPDELDAAGQHPAVSVLCLHCLLDDHPELGRGLDIARKYGVADVEGDEWVIAISAASSHASKPRGPGVHRSLSSVTPSARGGLLSWTADHGRPTA